MKQTIKQMEQEDEATRRKKHAAHMKYQQDLDAQLADLRQRSIKSLKGMVRCRCRMVASLPRNDDIDDM